MRRDTLTAYTDAYNLKPGGIYTGFHTLDPYFQIKLGNPHIFFGLPHSGKTEFAIEILINLANSKGITAMLFTPEGGNKSKVINEIAEKVIGKPIYQKNRDGSQNQYAATDEQLKEAYAWIDKYFTVLDKPDFPNPKEITIADVYAMHDLHGRHDITLIDTFTHLHDPNKQPIFDFVNDIYMEMAAYDREHYHATFMVVHCGKTQTSYNSQGIPYIRPPHPTEAHGGQMWYRLADSWIQVYINEMKGEDSPYEYETLLLIQKVRDKYSGKKGIVRIGWEPKRMGRYYENIDGLNYFGNEYETGNTLALAGHNTESDEGAPF